VAVETGKGLLAGRYRIVRPLGSGGMAVVFLCEDERLGRKVAVKRLHAHSPEDVERRFAREAKVGASLNHPNVVSVYDTATDDDGVLIVMEYVEGETLRDALKRGPLPTERVVTIVRDVAAALDHAHGHGVVHRDVKPANVLLRKDGVTKLVDLGIAVAADSTKITRSGMVLGSAAYMAPEQLDGKPAGPPADVYALATIAFEGLCGCKARPGATPLEIAHRVAVEPPPDLREQISAAPAGAAEMLKRAMARDPAERPGSAGELAAELERSLDDPATRTLERPVEEPPARPPVPPGGVEPPARAKPPARPTPPAPAPIPAPPVPPRGVARRGGQRGPVRSRPGSRRTSLPAVLSAVSLLVAAAAVIAALSFGGEDDGGDRASGGAEREEQPSRGGAGNRRGGGAPAAEQPTEPGAAGGTGAAPAGGAGTGASGSGASLNSQGYALMRQGRYREAVPVLQRAVETFPESTSDLQYAYALYNLGRSLRLAGRPREAVPILERRLRIPNQTATVRKELDAARRAAG
jgi:eukaryotic-like serine/threonine-protein kinase